jgi:hypothetical protein
VSQFRLKRPQADFFGRTLQWFAHIGDRIGEPGTAASRTRFLLLNAMWASFEPAHQTAADEITGPELLDCYLWGYRLRPFDVAPPDGDQHDVGANARWA